ncbi:prepilin-type N-terminal cleavage/methylation domain-containing protein [Parelusimicrobium proximum]|uniref:type IV pilin protein n=1 Tax=Parelusimicrobium proximum TaxID=3228953 RepID=UPI003D1859BF
MKKGFTLIELLVVVLIIAILAAVALPQYTKAVEKSRATQALIMLRALRDAQVRYQLQNDSFTKNFSELDVSIPNATSCGSSTENEQMCDDKWIYILFKTGYLQAKRNGINIEMNAMNNVMYCIVNKTDPKYTAATSVCQSLTGKTSVAKTNNNDEFYQF